MSRLIPAVAALLVQFAATVHVLHAADIGSPVPLPPDASAVVTVYVLQDGRQVAIEETTKREPVKFRDQRALEAEVERLLERARQLQVMPPPARTAPRCAECEAAKKVGSQGCPICGRFCDCTNCKCDSTSWVATCGAVPQAAQAKRKPTGVFQPTGVFLPPVATYTTYEPAYTTLPTYTTYEPAYTAALPPAYAPSGVWATPSGRPPAPGVLAVPGAPFPLDGPVRRGIRAAFGFDAGTGGGC